MFVEWEARSRRLGGVLVRRMKEPWWPGGVGARLSVETEPG